MSSGITIPLLMFLIASGFMILVGILIGNAAKKERNIYENGLETIGIVVACKAYLSDSKTGYLKRYSTTIEYKGADSGMHQGKLNYAGYMPIGRKVRIKYLPGKYDYVVFVSQEL